MVNYEKWEWIPHVIVKAWNLYSGKAGLLGGTLLIYLCAESTLRYYRWVTSFLFDVFITWPHPCGVCLTDTGRNNKQRACFRRHLLSDGSVLAFLRKPLLSCCEHECYRGTCWDCSGKNCNKSCSKSIDVCMCDVLLQHKSGHIRHLHQKHGSLTFHLTESFQGGSLFNSPCDWRVSSRGCCSLWMSMPSTALQLPMRRDFLKENEISGCNIEHF